MALDDEKSRVGVAVAQPGWVSGYRAAVQRLAGDFDRPVFTFGRAHPGRISGGWWEVQLLIRGDVDGAPAAVAVERHQCPGYSLGPLDEGCVNSFRILLAEVGVARGVLFSYTGFSAAAQARAVAGPDILPISLGTPYRINPDRPHVYVPALPHRETADVTEPEFAAFLRGRGRGGRTPPRPGG
ncbi:hypothetical protein [Catenuloplanes japonicus]|uniref:hypothetical protein n=1 Tax=Catenuloplanes japonicus TaxID=33876 RepID=UPI0005255E62|nr:hypothetical protein [Catenuloplanes japonicus]